MDTSFLKEVGLSEGESIIYLALLKQGMCSVSRLAEVSGQHRTHIYDTLEKLKERGLVSYVKKQNKKYFSASDPDSLLNYIDEKRKRIENNIDELKKLREVNKGKTTVEVYTGQEGMKTIYRDIIRNAKELKILGAGGQFREKIPIFSEQYDRDVKNKKIKQKILFTLGAPSVKDGDFKFLPQEYKSPLVTYSYGDKAVISIWGEELIGILVENKEFAEGFRQQFDLLWNQKAKVFTGTEGLNHAIFEVLKGNGKEVLCTGYDVRLREIYSPEIGDKWQAERIKKGIKFRAISVDNPKNREYNKKRVKQYFYDYRFTPKFVSGPATYFICGDKMSITYYSTEEVKTILIEDEEIVNQYIEHFEEVWKNASE